MIYIYEYYKLTWFELAEGLTWFELAEGLTWFELAEGLIILLFNKIVN
jgi:hypothetical protein